ncbi:hypothetical protein ACFL96_03100 [Thermoproteota archaeon]
MGEEYQALDMKNTIDFYKEHAPLLKQRLDELYNDLRDHVMKFAGTGHRTNEGAEHIKLSGSEFYCLLGEFPEFSMERAALTLNGINGRPDAWFLKNSKGRQEPTNDVSEAFGPTYIIPSYCETDYDNLTAKIILFGLNESVKSGVMDDFTAKIIHVQGFWHEYCHVINMLGLQENYDKGKAPQLIFPPGSTLKDGSQVTEMSALDALVEFGNYMQDSTPISHYSSAFWENNGNGVILKPSAYHMMHAIDEELAETVAALHLGIAFKGKGIDGTDPFSDRSDIKKYTQAYLNAIIRK